MHSRVFQRKGSLWLFIVADCFQVDGIPRDFDGRKRGITKVVGLGGEREPSGDDTQGGNH
jgi:hypothetical protein